MAGNITVTPEELRSVSAQLNNAAGTIEETLGSIRGHVEELAAGWKGSGATHFQSLVQEWHRDATGLHDVLTQIALNLGKAAQEYEHSDQQISNAFS